MRVGYKVLVVVFLFPLVLFAAENSKQNTQGSPTELAVDSAQQWLQIIDAGNYADGWENASECLKHAVTKDSFKHSLQVIRKPLGKVKNRSLSGAQYSNQMPGVPDGEYVVIQFKTQFENKAYGVETITFQKEKDGRWKVSGYYIN